MIYDVETLPKVQTNDFKAVTHISEALTFILDVLKMRNYFECLREITPKIIL